jgi:uncharacterized protein (UPF0335 family)
MQNLQVSAQKQLKQLIEAVERLEEEKKALAGDIKDKFEEAKSLGFDVKIMRKVIATRKKSKADYLEEEALLETYLHAVSWLDTPLGSQTKSGSLNDEIAETLQAAE